MLVKNADFRIVLIVLQANARLHELKAAGRISLQVVTGHFECMRRGRPSICQQDI